MTDFFWPCVAQIMQSVDIKAVGKHDLAVEWVGSATNDMVADSVIALLLGIDGSRASVKGMFDNR